VVDGADVFLGCSAAGVLTADMVKTMAATHHPGAGQPRAGNPPRDGQGGAPGLHHRHRPFGLPNQVNNVLCFPYIFRGALDCGATKITEAMKLACVREIAALAKAEPSDEVAAAYAGKELSFGPTT
jgi:malate dehydrogenase (oxaloacetate-decarboxylating)(NADP+)